MSAGTQTLEPATIVIALANAAVVAGSLPPNATAARVAPEAHPLSDAPRWP